MRSRASFFYNHSQSGLTWPVPVSRASHGRSPVPEGGAASLAEAAKWQPERPGQVDHQQPHASTQRRANLFTTQPPSYCRRCSFLLLHRFRRNLLAVTRTRSKASSSRCVSEIQHAVRSPGVVVVASKSSGTSRHSNACLVSSTAASVRNCTCGLAGFLLQLRCRPESPPRGVS